MNYQILRLLQREEVDRIVSALGQSAFADGRQTAQGQAREVKRNLQVERTAREPGGMDRVIIAAFQRHPEFQAFALPKRMMLPTFSRYDPGMEYGPHVDNALMGGPDGGRIRSDLAVTLFLSSPASYDGGALVMDTPTGEEEIKLDAGEAIVYPASSIHYVAPVTRGTRLAAVTWVQSMVRDERLRTILYDLARASKQADIAKSPDLLLVLGKSYHNLLRYAAEP
jgi:PKHD-type hydroxylase